MNYLLTGNQNMEDNLFNSSIHSLTLVGKFCVYCDCKIFPPRDVCPNCSEFVNKFYKFSGMGEVYSYTTVYKASAGYELDVPYIVALVRLDEGPLITVQLTDIGDQTVEIGMPVEMVTRKLHVDKDGREIYGYKFRPLLSVSSKA